jgi:hypothetical protein
MAASPPDDRRSYILGHAETDIDTPAGRMRDELVAKRATVVAPSLVAAWTRKA